MSVARAAALSANFPPVFSDAAIDGRDPETKGKDDKRFWVTDGGTVENRGVVTLYLSIEDALDKRELEQKLRPDEPERDALELLLDDKEWPPLHVVIADVSAVGGPYKESYGLQSVQSAGGQMGLALEAELLDDLQRLYGDHEFERDGPRVPHAGRAPRRHRDPLDDFDQPRLRQSRDTGRRKVAVEARGAGAGARPLLGATGDADRGRRGSAPVDLPRSGEADRRGLRGRKPAPRAAPCRGVGEALRLRWG